MTDEITLFKFEQSLVHGSSCRLCFCVKFIIYVLNIFCFSFIVYVFLGSTQGLIDMMTAMESLKLFAKGEYMVIFVDMMTYSPNRESLKYLMSK